MKTTQRLHDLGQSLWLDNITRDLLDSGTLQRYIGELSITGLTSNPTIFDEAVANSMAYDEGICESARGGKSAEALFTELALEDLRRAADLLRPTYDATEGMDGWVSMEVSPLLANDTPGTIKAAARIFQQADRPNLFIKIPGTPAGIPAIEESIFAGVPINVTLLFSREQYLAAAGAYLRGIERRLAAGRHPRIASVASLFVSRWDKAVGDTMSTELRNRLGIAISGRTYRAYRELLVSRRWNELAAKGARPQRSASNAMAFMVCPMRISWRNSCVWAILRQRADASSLRISATAQAWPPCATATASIPAWASPRRLEQ